MEVAAGYAELARKIMLLWLIILCGFTLTESTVTVLQLLFDIVHVLTL